MDDLGWSASEKKLARAAYDDARAVALAKVMADFKTRAAAATTPDDMWDVADFLRQSRREIDDLFDYRYSQLLLVFARLIRQGYLDEGRLDGLSEEKVTIIRRLLAL